MSAFSELQRITENLDLEECLSVILDGLFDANDIFEKDERIPVFIGTVKSNNAGRKRIVDIRSAWGSPININPYLQNPYGPNNHFYTVPKGRSTEGDTIVFIGTCHSPLEREWEILDIADSLSLREIGVENDAGAKEILNVIRYLPTFWQYKQQIEKLLIQKNAFEEKKTELDRVISELEDKKSELEQVKSETEEAYDDFRDLKSNIKTDFPQGLEAAREEYSELKANLSSYRAEKENYDRLQENLDKLSQKIQEVVPEGKTVDDVLEALNEYETNKDAISDVLRLLRQQYDRSVSIRHYDLDETILPDKSISSITFLKNSRLGFEYPDDVVKQFMSALSTNQIITLFGKPGTGKTTFVREMAKALGARCSMVRVQNNWTDKSDIIGYYDPIHEVFNSTEFLEAILAAKKEFELKNYDSRLHFICLDEMNLARVEYYFAEFLSLLQDEQDQQVLALLPPYIEQDDELPEKLSRYRSFVLPPNVRFIGTINKDDSTNSLSPKVIDRSFFIELSSETYSEKKQVEERKGYYPLNFFTPDGSTKCSISLFENENGRFKAYMEQMYGFYKGKFGQKDDNAFVSFMILAKILPAVERVEDIRPEYNNPQYTLAKNRIDSLTPTNGGYIDYLGGN